MTRVLTLTIGANFFVAFLKALYGYKANSASMIADGLHSAIHAAGGVFALGGMHLASRPPDETHPYGYERYEPLTAMAIGGLMIAAMFAVASTAIEHIRASEIPALSAGSFVAMVVASSFVIAVGRYQQRWGDRLASTLLRADGRRMFADGLVSVSVLAGMVLTVIGIPLADTLLALVVAAAIGRTAWLTIREASQILTDAAVSDIDRIATIARSVPGVRGCHDVRARGVSGRVFIDLHMTVDPQTSVADAHRISEEVARRVRDELGGVAEVLVHIGAASFHDSS